MSTAEDFYKYQCQRHERYIANREKSHDLAFKTSERYDQWVLTISGGALAISLTFLEKIAPHPAVDTIYLMRLSWIALVVSVLAGFVAIYLSREAIYEQCDIDEQRYKNFRQTANETKIEGDEFVAPKNKFLRALSIANATSVMGVVTGITCLCLFVYQNVQLTANPTCSGMVANQVFSISGSNLVTAAKQDGVVVSGSNLVTTAGSNVIGVIVTVTGSNMVMSAASNTVTITGSNAVTQIRNP